MFSRTPKPVAKEPKQSIIKPPGTSLLSSSSRPTSAGSATKPSNNPSSSPSSTLSARSATKSTLKTTSTPSKPAPQSVNQTVSQSVPASQSTTRSNSLDLSEPESLASLVSQLFNQSNKQSSAIIDDDVIANDETFSTRLNTIRTTLLLQGIDEDHSVSPSENQPINHPSLLRGQIWQLMLGVSTVHHHRYVGLLERKQSSVYSKIRSDSFRTFPRDQLFQRRVSESSIVRLLNAFVWDCAGQFSYVQGMNTIAAPMLFCMPELNAYAAFHTFITEKTPLYWISAHIGVQAGCKLVDAVLKIIDPQLFEHLSMHRCESYVYAFHCVSSFSASVPPFSELLILWDFLCAFGLHLNILCVVASIISMREKLLQSNKPNNELNYRIWPEMKARQWISMALSFVSLIDSDLYEDIRKHPYDRQTAEKITGRKVERRIE